jgi:hypothetical protein
MCEEYLMKEKLKSHALDIYGGFDLERLKYLIRIYKRYEKYSFFNREIGVYNINTK